MYPHNELLTWSTILGLCVALPTFSIPSILHHSRKTQAETIVDRNYGNNNQEYENWEREKWHSIMGWQPDYTPTSKDYKDFIRDNKE